MMSLVRCAGMGGRWCWQTQQCMVSWIPVGTQSSCGGNTHTSPWALTSHPVSRLTHTSSEEAGVRWRFPASDRVLGMISQLNNGTWNNGVHITCNSTKPLHPDQFQEMLTHLSNKMEVLRTSFCHRGSELWIADVPKPSLDFKVVPWNDINDEIQDLMLEPYNLSEGPLWRARLMRCPDNAPCKYPEIKKNFPHQCNLLMCFHHAMIDGVTSCVVIATVFQLLEDIVAGKPIDGSKLGEVIGDSDIVRLEQEIRAKLERDPERLEILLKKRSEYKIPILVEAFGSPEVLQPSTRIRPPYSIDNERLARLQFKCRARGVTLNSGLMGILSTALVELVREAGLVRDVYTVATKHPVNLRRYMDGPTINYHGFYSVPMSHSMTLPHNARKHFWENVRKFDVEFREKLERNYSCEERVLDDMLRPPGYSHEEHFVKILPVNYDFSFSNVYSGKETNFGVGKHVQITAMVSHTQITNCEFGMLFVIAGFRDQINAQFFYSTGRLTPETAQSYANKAISILNDVSD